MAGNNPTRRRFLVTTALGGIGLVGTDKFAQAFTPQKMTADEHRAYMNACSSVADPYHKQLADELAARLGSSVTPAALDQALAAARCPICGCSLAASRDAGPA